MNVMLMFREWLRQASLVHKVCSLFGIVGFMGIASYYLVVTPQLDRLASLDQKRHVLTGQIAQERAKLAQLDQLIAETKRLDQVLDVRKARLPAKPEAIALLERISDLAAEMELTVKLWRPGDPVEDDSKLYVKLPVSVELIGPYHTLGRFFDHVQKSSRLMSVFNLQMGPAVMDAGKTAIQTGFDLAAFASKGDDDTRS